MSVNERLTRMLANVFLNCGLMSNWKAMKAVVETGADFVHFQAIKRIRRGTSSVG
jgi:hypothetical protein